MEHRDKYNTLLHVALSYSYCYRIPAGVACAPRFNGAPTGLQADSDLILPFS